MFAGAVMKAEEDGADPLRVGMRQPAANGIFRNSTTFVSFSKEVFYQIFQHWGQSETSVWVKWSWLDVPDISQIKFMAQLLLQSAQFFSPGKTRVVSLCCLCFVVPQPRANQIKTSYIWFYLTRQAQSHSQLFVFEKRISSHKLTVCSQMTDLFHP